MTSELQRLCNIMTQLRAPGGCGWDRKQTLSSLKKHLIEETYETIDAIDDVTNDPSEVNIREHKEELGDLLFQIVFQAEIQRESGAFEMNDICRTLSEKLVRRHPHIFGEESKDTSDTNPHWERIKEQERASKGTERLSALDGVPKSIPGLMRAKMLATRASEVGFDWPDYQGARDKLLEEVGELKEVVDGPDRAKIEHELGDVMLACVDLARHLDLDAEAVMRAATSRFESRFRHMELMVKSEGKVLSSTPLDELERHWQRAKRETI